jgi:sterol desaturase/sphingolipid hydroxylase (fatty acid hydroxylase superfamily)
VNRDALIGLSLLGWFVALAVAEAIWPGHEKAEGSGDGRLLTNFGLTVILIVAASLFPLARMSASLFGERLGLGVANMVPMPWPAVFGAMLLLDSFSAYWVHRLMHATPLLWRVHRVHHADSSVDVSTSLRNHPFELLVTVPVSCLVVLLLGAPVSVVVAAQTVVMAAAIWQHADLRLPRWLDHALARAIVTPRLHRLHHSRERLIHDTNFGDFITLWDRLFGTFNGSEGRRPVGLEGQAARADHLADQIWSPLQAA